MDPRHALGANPDLRLSVGADADRVPHGVVLAGDGTGAANKLCHNHYGALSSAATDGG